MIIGNTYADNCIYRGVRYYDSLPLLSKDLIEESDTTYQKNSYFMKNLLGSGIINNPNVSISSSGITLSEPAVLNIEGDIVLAQASEGPIISSDLINSVSYEQGTACLVGWYQHITAADTVKAYGGVNNESLENTLAENPLSIQVSTRYQFKWDVVILAKSTVFSKSSAISFSLKNRDKDGNLTSGSTTITTDTITGDVRIAQTPASMDYAVSPVYLIPLINYNYSQGTLVSAKCVNPRKPSGAIEFISSVNMPSGEYTDGTIWYNPNTYRFKFYVNGEGFLSTSSDVAFIQLTNTVELAASSVSSRLVSIGINSYTEGDILQVIYEGATLTLGTHYNVNYSTKTITLASDFHAIEGDSITFTVTKLISTNEGASIAAEFNNHVNTESNDIVLGHVKLSDNVSSENSVSNGIAATPKAVYEATTIKDSTSNKNYRFFVESGLLYLEEV